MERIWGDGDEKAPELCWGRRTGGFGGPPKGRGCAHHPPLPRYLQATLFLQNGTFWGGWGVLGDGLFGKGGAGDTQPEPLEKRRHSGLDPQKWEIIIIITITIIIKKPKRQV